MRKAFLFSFLLVLLAVALVNCGDSRPAIQPVTNSLAFLREAPAGSEGPIQPILGTFRGTAFTAQAIKDPSTGKPVTADIHSIILSLDGKKATFDMWPSASTYGRTTQASYWPDVWVANKDGSKLTQITHGETYVAHPSFSPDSSKVIFLASNSSSPYDTMIANIDGSNMVDLTADSPICHHEATFSPDGTKIVFAGHNGGPSMDIYVMNADGTQPVNLTNELTDAVENLLPTFSPDGKQIAFTKVTYGETLTGDIYVMNSDGTNAAALTTTGLDWYPRYLGKMLTFNSYRDGNMEIYSMATDGTSQKRLTNNTVYDAFSADEFYVGSGLKAQQRLHLQHR